jgi:hypothetical protein
VVRWENKVTPGEASKADYSGITATLLHQGNVYKVKCTFLIKLYKEDTDPKNSDSDKGQPCTALSSYVGKVILSDNISKTYDGWIISIQSDTEGQLMFSKYIPYGGVPDGGVPVGGVVKAYHEIYSIVSVEAEKKEAK